MPPFLAGRDAEIREFRRLLDQDVILENMVLTGLRGVGKTVLLERFKPMAMKEGWLWVGAGILVRIIKQELDPAVRARSDATSNVLHLELAEDHFDGRRGCHRSVAAGGSTAPGPAICTARHERLHSRS